MIVTNILFADIIGDSWIVGVRKMCSNKLDRRIIWKDRSLLGDPSYGCKIICFAKWHFLILVLVQKLYYYVLFFDKIHVSRIAKIAKTEKIGRSKKLLLYSIA